MPRHTTQPALIPGGLSAPKAKLQELSEKLNALEQQYGQKFKDIEQVLNYLIQKDQKSVQQGTRKEIGFKK